MLCVKYLQSLSAYILIFSDHLWNDFDNSSFQDFLIFVVISEHPLWKLIKATCASIISVSLILKCPDKCLEGLEGLKHLFDFKFRVIVLYLEEVKEEAYCFSSTVKNRKKKIKLRIRAWLLWASIILSYAVQDLLIREWCSPKWTGSSHINNQSNPHRHAQLDLDNSLLRPFTGDSRLCQVERGNQQAQQRRKRFTVYDFMILCHRSSSSKSMDNTYDKCMASVESSHLWDKKLQNWPQG